MPLKAFQEALQSLAALTNASDYLPQIWINLCSDKVPYFCSTYALDVTHNSSDYYEAVIA
jgi:hypothetical protein